MEDRCKKSLLFSIIFFYSIASFISPGLVYAALSASNSTVTVEPSSVPASGTNTATITVKLLDDANPPGPVNNHRVELSLAGMTDSNLVINGGIKGASNLTIQTGNSGNAANVATFTVSSNSVQTDKFNIRDVDQNVSLSQASVNFTSPSCGDSTPATPTLSQDLSQSSSQIKLSWTAVSVPISYYVVSYGISSGNYIYGNPNVGKQNNYTVGFLSQGTTYYFVVKAVNGCSSGSYSNELSAIAGQNPTPTPIPTPTSIPTLSQTATSTQASTFTSSKNSNDQKSKESISDNQLKTNPTLIPQHLQTSTKKPARTLIANMITKNFGILALVWGLFFIFGGFFLYFNFKKEKPKTLKPPEQEESLDEVDIKN